MKEVLIFGHKKPDTDAVTSAIALSYLKNKLGILSKPMILSPINDETKFVLDYFNIATPKILDDVKLQLKDLNYYKGCFINQNSSIGKAYEYINSKNITGVPIVDDSNKFKGLLTSKILSETLFKNDFTYFNAFYDNILEILNGEEILRFDDNIIGNIVVDLNEGDLSNSIIITSNSTIIDYAIENKIKLLIIVDGLSIDDMLIKQAKINNVNIIKTNYSAFYVIKLINLCNSVFTLLNKTRNICFNENCYYDDFKEKSLKLGYNNYPIITSGKKCLGLIRITDIGKLDKKKVILVDHNEASQSVEGLEEAEVLEIIDHHKIGTITTNMPINFRNMTVGSTNTIIYSMFIENDVEIPKDIAGIMLSGIISDTLKFTSPTTSEYDKYVAYKLKDIALIDIDDYSKKMFKAGTNLKGKTIDEIINADIKVVEINNKKIAISQIFTLNAEEILEKKDEYVKKIQEVKSNKEYDSFLVCLTDIIKDGTYLFFDQSSTEIVKEAFDINSVKQGVFINSVVSRKKQIIPKISEFVR